MRRVVRRVVPAIDLALAAAAVFVRADGTPQTLPFAQDWTNPGADYRQRQLDRRARHPGLPRPRPHRRDRRRSADCLLGRRRRRRSRRHRQPGRARTPSRPAASPSSRSPNPTIALNGSRHGRRALHPARRSTRPGQSAITRRATTLRDLDGSVDNAVQPVALHFRVGRPRPFTNVPAGFVADATTGPSLADLVTPVSVVLPAAAENQAAGPGPHHHRQRRRQRRVGGHRRHHRSTAGGGRPQPALSRRPTSRVAEGDTGVVTAHVRWSG